MRHFRFAGLLILQAAVLGCSQRRGWTIQVSCHGRGNLRRHSDVGGAIVFVPQNSTLAAEAGTIQEGKYQVHVTAGLQQVHINASREVPGKTWRNLSGDIIPLREDYVPARYNLQIELSAENNADKKNEYDFHLTEISAPD